MLLLEILVLIETTIDVIDQKLRKKIWCASVPYRVSLYGRKDDIFGT